MSYPKDIGIIDTMLGIPSQEDRQDWYESFKPLLKDEESRKMFSMPAQYMFKDIPETNNVDDFVKWTVEHLDRHNIETALVGFNPDGTSEAATKNYPGRFAFEAPADPNGGMAEVRRLKALKEEHDIKAVPDFPAGTGPQVRKNDGERAQGSEACVEMDVPIILNVGVPGPRIPLQTQKVEHLDDVCWFFPELKVVMRHGAEPWEDLAVKLMLKYPNLYYSTSAFAPKHYPQAIIDYANKRGSEKIIYGGYFPMGLSLDRIFSDMENVPFNDDVWPKFLRENAKRVFKI